ncbi:MAG: cell wall-binding repeat-containing protein [Coriobacteriia bacterium]
MHRSHRPAIRALAVALAAVALVSTATPAFAAISRTLVMQRAQRWVDVPIPYSPTAYRDLDGVTATVSTGWRTDCSGFVSMAWNTSKPGYSTRTLDDISDLVTKEALQPGDAMVAYDRHAVLFGGWADAARTQYFAYEMSSGASKGTGDGTVMRVTPYPYWPSYYPNEFKPYRLRSITANIDYSQVITPIEGTNRYSTAVAASASAFDTGTVDTVVIASGEDWPDALGAAALAGAVDGPVLLTQRGALPTEVRREILRLGASEVIVAGGEGAISSAVLAQLEEMEGVSARRIPGGDRYATSAAIARETVRLAETGGFDGTVFIATGENFPDALAASPLAAASGRPILLTEGDRLSAETSSAISTMAAHRAVILGGTGPVSSAVEASLTHVLASGEVTRVAGRDRYETAASVAAMGVAECGLGYDGLAIATGEDFPDALAGGVMAARHGTVLMLTPSFRLHTRVSRILLERQATMGRPYVLGGESVLEPIVREAIALALQVFE